MYSLGFFYCSYTIVPTREKENENTKISRGGLFFSPLRSSRAASPAGHSNMQYGGPQCYAVCSPDGRPAIAASAQLFYGNRNPERLAGQYVLFPMRHVRTRDAMGCEEIHFVGPDWRRGKGSLVSDELLTDKPSSYVPLMWTREQVSSSEIGADAHEDIQTVRKEVEWALAVRLQKMFRTCPECSHAFRLCIPQDTTWHRHFSEITGAKIQKWNDRVPDRCLRSWWREVFQATCPKCHTSVPETCYYHHRHGCGPECSWNERKSVFFDRVDARAAALHEFLHERSVGACRP